MILIKKIYIDELKEIQEKFDYQNVKVKELKSELNEKNKNIDKLKNNIKDLENEKHEIINKSGKNFETINKTYNRKIEKKKNILMIMKKIELKKKKFIN